jgi:hypothetical protein
MSALQRSLAKITALHLSHAPCDFVETITSASAAIGTEMSPDAFREWLMDETRDPDF